MRMASTSGASATGSGSKSTALFACSKCFSRHPFEELSQGQQLCKECRGSFPVVKCTYCRSEFQQESKSSTSSICKKCESNVQKYGKPSSCQYCSIIAAFVNGKCHRCHDSYRKYGAPKSCEQCKQKCAFDKDDKKKVDGKLLCWLCSLSYKRALVRTKQSDPARHSRVFKPDKKKERREHRDKYFNHKKPQRPDVTKTGVGLDEPLAKIVKKKERPDSDTDHVAEITQLKEKIASMSKTIMVKNNELLAKQGEMTAMKAKLFNEERLIKEKMKKMQKEYEEKIQGLQRKVNELSVELSKAKREAGKPNNKAMRRGELFPGTNKKDMISSSVYRPAPPPQKRKKVSDDNEDSSRSQSGSPTPQGSKRNSRSRSRSRSLSRSRSRSRSISSPPKEESAPIPAEEQMEEQNQEAQVQVTPRADEPVTEDSQELEGGQHLPERAATRSSSRSSSRSPSRSRTSSRSRSRSSVRSRSRSVSADSRRGSSSPKQMNESD